MKVYLLNHPNDFAWIGASAKSDSHFIAHEDHISRLLGIEIPSFYRCEFETQEIDMAINYLTFNWHRDNNGIDLFSSGSISIAEAFSTGLWINISGICREYFALQFWLKKYETISISSNESEEFKEIAKTFGSRIEIFDPNHQFKLTQNSLNNRILRIQPIKWYLEILRLCQCPILFFWKAKVLAIQDWTLAKFAKNQSNWLSLNSPFFWRSAYLRSPSKKYLLEAENLVPKDFNQSFLPESLVAVLNRINISWDVGLITLISRAMTRRYLESRNYFIWCFALYSDLLETYMPSEFVVTTEMFEPYMIASQIAREKNIKTSCMVDGYPVITYSRWVGNNRIGPDFFDRVYAIGTQHAALLNKAKPPGQEVITIFPPILLGSKLKLRVRKKYDVIIMTLIPNDLSINGRNGSRINNLIDMIEVAKAFGFSKIGIKIKHPMELELLETVLNKISLFDGVTILSGPFSKHVEFAKIIIGGISSAIGEASYQKIPYYIYEPISNGFSCEMISSSLIFGKKDVARTKDELQELLRNPNGSIIKSAQFLFGDKKND